jgi:hypothetical protein
MNSKHYLRYGTAADQKYMKEYRHTYDGVALNGTMLAHISKAISAFLHKDLMGKALIIDPMTHAFQHDLDKIKNSYGDIKSSVGKLIEIYGDPVATAINSKFRPVRQADFTDQNTDDFISKVLNFQMNHLKINLDDKFQEYIEFYGLYQEPSILIAPYFYLTHSNIDKWLDLNCKLLERSLRVKGEFNKPIFAQLVINRDLLIDENNRNQLLSCLSRADGLLYWIDGLDEVDATIPELSAIKSLVLGYRKLNPDKEIISLYGGYFTELLLEFGLSGIVHGLEYGENREVVPVGGGIPQSKYYLPPIKKRVPAPTMLNILRFYNIATPDRFFNEICDCKVCKKTIKKAPIDEDFNEFIKVKPEPKIIRYKKSGNIREIFFPDKESKEKCLFHYLEVKHKEINNISKKGIRSSLGALLENHEKFSAYFSEGEVDYLKDWHKVLVDA